jgi:hypothetical protein
MLYSWRILSPARLSRPDFITDRFIGLGISDYRQAAHFVSRLPYRCNSDPSDPLIVLDEACGTCSTKHALRSVWPPSPALLQNRFEPEPVMKGGGVREAVHIANIAQRPLTIGSLSIGGGSQPRQGQSPRKPFATARGRVTNAPSQTRRRRLLTP